MFRLARGLSMVSALCCGKDLENIEKRDVKRRILATTYGRRMLSDFALAGAFPSFRYGKEIVAIFHIIVLVRNALQFRFADIVHSIGDFF